MPKKYKKKITPLTKAKLITSVSLAGDRLNGAKPLSTVTREVEYSATVNTLLLDIDATTTEGSVQDAEIGAIRIQNDGDVSAFLMASYQLWTDATTMDTFYHVNYLLTPGEEMILPNSRAVISDAGIEPLAGTAVDATAPNSNMYTDSTADVDSATANGVVSSASATTLYLEPYTSAANCTANLFRIGDLIQISSEIMEIVAIGDKSDLANNYLTVIRGLYGSDASTFHADDHTVRFPFFNMYADFDKYSVCQTNRDGRFASRNLFGYGRSLTGLQGLVPGSFALQFYEYGYQELGLSGITANTHSGLTASTEYKLDITVDGGSLFQDLSFTTSSSNLNFGGTDGIIQKLNEAFEVQYYTAGNLFEKEVIVEIVNGDIRFSSGQYLSTSAILLADTGDSGSFIDAAANGRIPASGNIPAPVAARLAPEQEFVGTTYKSKYSDIFAKDDGSGNIYGVCGGTIDYETGSLEIWDAPPNAEFVVSVIHTSAFSGKISASDAGKVNSLKELYANIPNQKSTGKITVKTYPTKG